MTVQEVRQSIVSELQIEQAVPFFSALMPLYGIVQDQTAALTAPSIDRLFTDMELEAMAQDATLLEQARNDLRNYQETYFWDGYVRDSRYAYVVGTHDFEGTRRTFQQFRAEEQHCRAMRQGGK